MLVLSAGLVLCDGYLKKHAVIDILAPKWAPVFAAENATVVVVSYDPTWCYWATLEHRDWQGLRYTSVYWHIVPAVSQGQTVSRGQQIGWVADMGANTHLHFGGRNAPYSNTANRGALPRYTPCGTYDPVFPEVFVNPLWFTSP